MLYKTLLGKTPEPFETVDVDTPPGELLSVVNLEMPVTAEHQAVIYLEAIGVYNASPADLLQSQTEHGLGPDIGNGLNPYMSLPFQDPEDWYFACGSPAPGTLPSAAEIGFVQFDLTLEVGFGILSMGKNCLSKRNEGLVNSVIGQSDLSGSLPCGNLQLEELDDPEPVLTRQGSRIDPSSGEVMEGVAASAATPPCVCKSVELACPASGAEALMVFPAESQQVSSSRRRAGNQ